MNKEKKTFIDFIFLLTKWRKFLLINLFLVGVISLIISFQLPKWYKATAILRPPAEDQAGGLSSLLSNIPLAATMGLGSTGGSELTYMAILKSRSLAKEVIDKFDLMNFYEDETMYETYISFDSDLDAQLTEENMISITFEYTDSVKVAEIVNFIVDRLSVKSTSLMIERAKRTMKYVERRYFQNLGEMDSLAIAMEFFNKKHGIIEFESQTKALIEMTATIEADIFIKETELETLERSHGKDSPQYMGAKTALEILRKHFNDLITNQLEPSDSPFSSLFISLADLPELTREYAELYSNYLLQTKLQEYLLPEYEQAKLQVQKDDPTLQVIDTAVPPDRKSKPKKAFIILGAVVVAFVLQMMFILFIEYLHSLKVHDEEKYNLVQEIKRKWGMKTDKSNSE